MACGCRSLGDAFKRDPERTLLQGTLRRLTSTKCGVLSECPDCGQLWADFTTSDPRLSFAARVASRAEWEEIVRLGDAALIQRLGMGWHLEAENLKAADLESSKRLLQVMKILRHVLEGLG
jgi:hypothetical protein